MPAGAFGSRLQQMIPEERRRWRQNVGRTGNKPQSTARPTVGDVNAANSERLFETADQALWHHGRAVASSCKLARSIRAGDPEPRPRRRRPNFSA